MQQARRVRRYVVVGCGAVGGLYGARLAAAGHPLGFLARSDVDHLRRSGLVVESVDGDVRLPAGSFAAASDPAELGEADVVVVAIKTTDNGALGALLPPLVGPSTTVVVLQNGLGVEATAAAAAPAARAVVGGMCFVCAAKVGPAHVRHADYGAVTLAAHTGSLDDDGAVGSEWAKSGIEVAVTDDLVTARWRKLLWNVPFNGLTAVLDVGTDELLADPAARAMAIDLMAEVVAGGRACGARIGSADADEMVARTESMVPYRTSMALDRVAGRRTEHDTIYGAAVRAAAEAGVAMPRVEQLWRMLELLDVTAAGRTSP